MRKSSSGSATSGFVDSMDRVGLWIVRLGATAVAALHLARLILSGREMLGDGPIEVDDLAVGNARTPEFTEPFAAITEARYESVTITLDSAPSTARWLLWGADAVASLAVIGICVALVWLCLRVGHQRPFGRSVTAALLATATLVMVGGMAQQLLAAIGRAELVDHLGTAPTAADPGAVEGFANFALDLSLTPLGIGLAIGVVAGAFEIGARMQRDTEGLV